jgi:hypothetical protein
MQLFTLKIQNLFEDRTKTFGGPHATRGPRVDDPWSTPFFGAKYWSILSDTVYTIFRA